MWLTGMAWYSTYALNIALDIKTTTSVSAGRSKRKERSVVVMNGNDIACPSCTTSDEACLTCLRAHRKVSYYYYVMNVSVLLITQFLPGRVPQRAICFSKPKVTTKLGRTRSYSKRNRPICQGLPPSCDSTSALKDGGYARVLRNRALGLRPFSLSQDSCAPRLSIAGPRVSHQPCSVS